MGEGYSKSTINHGNLSEEEVQNIRKKFNLNKKELNETISTFEFIYAYPHILRPYIALVLPSFHEVLRKKNRHNKGKNSSTSNNTNNYGINYAINILFSKSNKKISNEISLQDIINILSYLHNVKSRIIIRILFLSFLRYSISNNNDTIKLNILEENDLENENNNEELNITKIVEANFKREDCCMATDTYEPNIYDDPQNNNDDDINDDNSLDKKRNSFDLVYSDSNVNTINKNNKKERNYKFIKDNIFIVEKNKITSQYPQNYIVKDLISIEEAIHHLFTYMYIEQLYLLCPSNMLFKLSNVNQLAEKDFPINNIKMKCYDDSIINRQNSWDLAFFFKELSCSLETNLDFKNIVIGFRLYANSLENNKNSIYSLVIEYINSTFTNMSTNYSNVTWKHFMNKENVLTEGINKDNKKKKKLSNAAETDIQLEHEQQKEVDKTNTFIIDENEIPNINDICINSIELIHSIYTSMKKNEIAKKDNKNKLLENDAYKQSASIIELQNSSKGWRGLFLNESSKILTDEIAFSLRQCSPCFSNNVWYRLYASWKQGTSFSRFMSCLFHYPSPIVIVIKTNDNQILGGVCTTPLKDSHLYHGCSNDFLFSAYPVFRIIRTNQFGTNYVYLNSKNSFYPKGLGFGGKPECFRLFLSDEFKDSYCTESDFTYKSGHLYFPQQKNKKGKKCNYTYASSDSKDGDNQDDKDKREELEPEGEQQAQKQEQELEQDDQEDDLDSYSFLYKLSISEVEAWGCGDEKALQEQKLIIQNEEACKQERRSTDKSKIVQNSFDKEFLLPKVFSVGKYEELKPST